jgi:hypothetical protein
VKTRADPLGEGSAAEMCVVIVRLPVADGDIVAGKLADAIREAGELAYELANGVLVHVPVDEVTVEE